jgi:hypothetical protein
MALVLPKLKIKVFVAGVCCIVMRTSFAARKFIYPQSHKSKFEVNNAMGEYAREELEEALKIVSSAISRCEKAQPKFAEGTSQHSLLKNRIKALYISKSLIADENAKDKHTKEELTAALRPVSSIISKCEKAQLKFAEGTSHHTRFKNMIRAMCISKSLITDEISKRS